MRRFFLKIMMIAAMICMGISGLFAQRELSGSLKITNPDDYHSTPTNIKSPEATAMELRSENNVDLFTGALSLRIPLLSLNHGNINVPVSLSYTGSGVRIDQYAGWVGLGWDLQAGGMISRKTNDLIDEYYNRKSSATGQDAGYYFLGKTLNRSDWSTTARLRSKFGYNLSDTMGDLEPDEFVFSFGGYSGSFFRSETGQWKVKSKQNLVLEIEEVVDNSGNYKNWLRFLPNIVHGDSFWTVSPLYERVATLFTQFTITTPDGFRYVFGGDTLAIELSRGAVDNENIHPLDLKENYITANAWYLTKIISPAQDTVTFEYKRARVLFKKYLSRSPVVNDDIIGHSSLPYMITGAAIDHTFLKAIHTPSMRFDFYVNQSTELGATPVEWINMEAIVGKAPKDQLCKNWSDLIYEHDAVYPLRTNMRKLDSIKVYDKQTQRYTNGVKLYYTQDATRRKTLDSLQFHDFANNVAGEKYKFEYKNVGSLPPYESVGKDHWGFLNNPSLTDVNTMLTYGINREPVASYCTYGLMEKIHYPTGGYTEFEFEPAAYRDYISIDPNLATPVLLQSYTTDKTAGVRIKSITNVPLYGGTPLKTSYHYKKNFISGGTSSSGILGMLPNYVDQVTYVNTGSGSGLGACGGTRSGSNTYAEASEWLQQYRGGIINYSEVAVQYPDGSTTVSHFTNSNEAAYRDEIHVNYAARTAADISHITANNNFRISSNDLERGKLQKEVFYDALNQRVREVRYQYLDDPARKNNFVKAVSYKVLFSMSASTCVTAFGTMGGPRAWAYKVYTYQNPLSSVREVDYFGTDTVVTLKNFSYDAHGNLTKESTLGSDGKEYIKNYKYNIHADYAGTATSAEAQGIRRLSTDYKIKNYLIEENVVLYDYSVYKVLGARLYTYSNVNPTRLSRILAFELAQPLTLAAGLTTYPMSKLQSGALSFHASFKEQRQFRDYTRLGIPGTIAEIASNAAFLVDNGSRFISAVVQNAIQTEIAYSNFEGVYKDVDENKGNWNFTQAQIITDATAPMGSACLRLLSWNDVGGGSMASALTSKYALQSGKKYTVSFWIKAPTAAWQVPVLKAGSVVYPAPELVKTVNGWNYYEGVVTGAGDVLIIGLPHTTASLATSRANVIDEVRLYPVTSAMNSCVRDPLSGTVKYVCDESSNIKKFELDGFKRLHTVRDEFNYIEEVLDYKFQVNN